MGVSSSTRLNEILGSGVKLPSMSAAGSELLALLQQPTERIETTRVVELIETDPTLTARLLRTANSPAFGLTRTVDSVRHAITLLGLNEALRIVNLHVMMNATADIQGSDRFSTDHFWIHSWACALGARMFRDAPFSLPASPNELYLAGLVHDIGKVVFASNLSTEFGQSLDQAHETNVHLWQAEREVIGVDHAALGGALLDQWNLPESVLDAVANHHAPAAAKPENRKLAAAVQVVDFLAVQGKIGDSGTPTAEGLSNSPLFGENDGAAANESRIQRLKAISASMREETDSLFMDDIEEEAPTPDPQEKIDSPAKPKAKTPLDGTGFWAKLKQKITGN